jgi:spore germination protein YaaH
MLSMDTRPLRALGWALGFFLLSGCLSSPGNGMPLGLDEMAEDAPAEDVAEWDGGMDVPLALPDINANLPISEFREIWAYVISGSEGDLKAGYPITDAFHFAATVNSYGQLTGVPNRKKVPPGFKGRVHVVAVCESTALTHFVLEQDRPVHRALVADLLAAAAPYDGLQIDFELVPANDGEAFLAFLGELREGLGTKSLTVALPARLRAIKNDVYDYKKIAFLVDKIFIMAYDEHWATSKPGPVASMKWGRAVAAYGLSALGPEKLVMGLPFYGRTWGNERTNRAMFYSGIERLKRENRVVTVGRDDGVPFFTYTIPVEVTAYYDDDYSLAARLDIYRQMGVQLVGFWRLGQESTTIWQLLKIRAE